MGVHAAARARRSRPPGHHRCGVRGQSHRPIQANCAHSQLLVRQISLPCLRPAARPQVRKGECWSIFLPRVCTRLNGSCACHRVGIQRLHGLAAATVRSGAPPQSFGPVSALLTHPESVTPPTANRVPSAYATAIMTRHVRRDRLPLCARRRTPSRGCTKSRKERGLPTVLYVLSCVLTYSNVKLRLQRNFGHPSSCSS